MKRRDVLTTCAAGVTAVAAMLSSGCAQPARLPADPPLAQSGSAKDGGSGLPYAQPVIDGVLDVGPSDPTPQTVNIFGELNGIGPLAVGPAGEAGFQQHTFADEGYDSDCAIDPT